MILNKSRSLKPLKTPRINVFGVNVDDISQKNAVDFILNLAKDPSGGHYVVTVNAEFVMLAKRDKEFAKILENADLAVADGWWVAKSRLIMGGREQSRLTGVDLVEILCTASVKKSIRIGFLGGFDNVAKVVSERQKKKNKGLKVVCADAGDPAIGYDLRLKSQLDNVGRIDIMFVAYGMGQQEFWIRRNLKKLDVGVYVGVGGALDYIGGVKRRAPKILQDLGLEWLWRLVMEPPRIWRQRIIPVFFGMILVEIIKKKYRLINK